DGDADGRQRPVQLHPWWWKGRDGRHDGPCRLWRATRRDCREGGIGWGVNNLHQTRGRQKEGPTPAPVGIEQHRDYLLHYALRRLRNRDLAEEAVHDSFLAALAGADKFLGKSSQRTWLIAILKHKVCDQVRRARRDQAIFELDPLTEHD